MTRVTTERGARSFEDLRAGDAAHGLLERRGFRVTHQLGGELVAFTAEAATQVEIVGSWVDVKEAWDGVGADLDVGAAGAEDGIIDGSAVLDLTAVAGQAKGQHEQGAMLWDGVEKAAMVAVAPAGASVLITVTPGTSATTGAAVVWIAFVRIRDDAVVDLS